LPVACYSSLAPIRPQKIFGSPQVVAAPPGSCFASAIATIQARSFIQRAPWWSDYVIIGCYAFMGLWIPRWSRWLTIFIGVFSLLAYTLVALGIFGANLIWISGVIPAGLVLFLMLYRLVSPTIDPWQAHPSGSEPRLHSWLREVADVRSKARLRHLPCQTSAQVVCPTSCLPRAQVACRPHRMPGRPHNSSDARTDRLDARTDSQDCRTVSRMSAQVAGRAHSALEHAHKSSATRTGPRTRAQVV
jgi:hypothetical protein